ncbi:MAG: tRNA adenosine(34) deaminase TadA [Planctomycetia bacterium]|nr:tRNA adenosine(34) deaminase TadA [Planctomycetia bacterium]
MSETIDHERQNVTNWRDDLVLETWTPQDGPRDEFFMTRALYQAELAMEQGEIPIGAVLVCQNAIIARDHNRRETLCDPTAHAEMLALRDAAIYYPSWRIEDAELFVTVEPCVMCAGALVMSRVQRVVYATEDPKAGAATSLYQILSDPRLNWRAELHAGVLKEDAANLLREFFRKKRQKKEA